MQMQATSPDQVILYLDSIIRVSRRTNSRVGFFASLYKQVSHTIHDAIDERKFDDNERMARVLVTFANRYFAALSTYRNKGTPSGPWNQAFKMTRRRTLNVLQHLLLGMNAHINYDLAITVATVVTADEMAGFKPDFMRINKCLGSLMLPSIYECGRIWPIISFADKCLDHDEIYVMDAGMDVARDLAWHAANQLITLPSPAKDEYLIQLDKQVTALARPIIKPPEGTEFLNICLTLADRDSVAQDIDILNNRATYPPLDSSIWASPD